MFQITGLPRSDFAHLFSKSDAELAELNAKRVVAQSSPGYPCRISLADADAGDTLILTNYDHLEGDTPYASRHAVYVRESAEDYTPDLGEVPDVLKRRLLSVRGFDRDQMIIDADVVEGVDLAGTLERIFSDDAVQEIHIHNAKQGCFAARAVRASAGPA